jgi:hypothetical protein
MAVAVLEETIYYYTRTTSWGHSIVLRGENNAAFSSLLVDTT